MQIFLYWNVILIIFFAIFNLFLFLFFCLFSVFVLFILFFYLFHSSPLFSTALHCPYLLSSVLFCSALLCVVSKKISVIIHWKKKSLKGRDQIQQWGKDSNTFPKKNNKFLDSRRSCVGWIVMVMGN